MTLPRVRSVDLEPIVYNDNEPVDAGDNLWWLHEPFPGETNIALRPCQLQYWKGVGRKNVLVMLGYHSIQQMLSI